jgi:hypothetical protein
MHRQLRLDFEEDAGAPVTLPAELQPELVALMADAIVAMLAENGGGDDDEADAQRED